METDDYSIIRCPPPLPTWYDFTYTHLIRVMRERKELKFCSVLLDHILSYINPEWEWKTDLSYCCHHRLERRRWYL